MAFTRKFLKALEIDEDKIEQIIDAHTEVTTALKADRDKYREDAEKLPDVQKELDKLKAEKEKADPYKEKYEKEHEDFEAFKKDVASKALKAEKKDAYKALLKKAGVADKFMDKIIEKMTSFDDIELENGEIKDADKMLEGIKKDYDIFLVKEGVRGAGTETPPTNTGGGKKTREEIYKKDEHGRYILSAQERQKAIAESLAQ